MVELNSEELKSLVELDKTRKSGESVENFISYRLYTELSHTLGPDEMGDWRLVKHPGFDEQYAVYKSLAEKGLLEGRRRPHSASLDYGDLTSEGRCYLSDKEAIEKEAKRAKWSERRFTIAASLITCIVSAILGYIAGHI